MLAVKSVRKGTLPAVKSCPVGNPCVSQRVNCKQVLPRPSEPAALLRRLQVRGISYTNCNAMFNNETLQELMIVWHPMPSAPRRVSRRARSSPKGEVKKAAFDVTLFLFSTGLGKTICRFRSEAIVFAQGDPAENVMYIQEGSLKLSVVNAPGKEAVVAILGPGDFVGEGCLAGQSICMAACRQEVFYIRHTWNSCLHPRLSSDSHSTSTGSLNIWNNAYCLERDTREIPRVLEFRFQTICSLISREAASNFTDASIAHTRPPRRRIATTLSDVHGSPSMVN